jgi:hypothetical protein
MAVRRDPKLRPRYFPDFIRAIRGNLRFALLCLSKILE